MEMQQPAEHDFLVVCTRPSTKTRVVDGPNQAVLSVNIDIDVYVGNGLTRIKLVEVPKFLVYAFNMITKFGLDIEGIFRKEGNRNRLNRAEVFNAYKGLSDIPSDFTVLDTCTMVKRFLRDLKPPLLNSAGFRKRLIEMAQTAREVNCHTLTHEEVASLFFDCEPALTPANHGTLGYLMRQLARIAALSDRHKMTVENLALVLVGSVFGCDGMGPAPKKKHHKDRRGSQDDLLASRKSDMEVQVSAVKLLIINANLIGLPRVYYVTSNGGISHNMMRSTSAMPFSRSDMNDLDFDDDLKNARTLVRRGSEATHIAVANAKAQGMKKKRSSSFLPTFRDIRYRVSTQFLKRNKSPSPVRLQSHGPAEVTATDANVVRKANAVRTESRTESIGSTSSAGRRSRSQHARRDNTNAQRNTPSPRPPDAISITAPALQLKPGSAGVKGNLPLRRLSQSDQNSSRLIVRRESEEKRAATKKDNLGEELMKTPRFRRHTTPIKSAIRRQDSVRKAKLPIRRATIMNSAEEKENFFVAPDPTFDKNEETVDFDDTMNTLDESSRILEQKALESRARRTAAKKRTESASMIVLNGSIITMDAGDKKRKSENNEKDAMNQRVTSPQQATDAPPGAVPLLIPPIPPHQRQTSSTFHQAVPLADESHVAVYVRQIRDSDLAMRKEFRSVATSPLVFIKSEKKGPHGRENGHAWVGNKQLVSLSPQPPSRQPRARLSYDKANQSPLRLPTTTLSDGTTISECDRLGLASPRLSLSPVMRHIAQTNNSPAQLITSTSTMPRTSSSPRFTTSSSVMSPLTSRRSSRSGIESSVAPQLPPPVPPHSARLSANGLPPLAAAQEGGKQRGQLVSQNSLDSLPVGKSKSSLPPMQEASASSLKTNGFASKDDVFKMPQLPVGRSRTTTETPLNQKEPVFRQPLPKASVEEKRGTKSVGSEDPSYDFSENFTNVILSSTFENDSQASELFARHQIVETRPSVVLIRSNQSGLVRARVNHFQEMAHMSNVDSLHSGRASAMSAYGSDRESFEHRTLTSSSSLMDASPKSFLSSSSTIPSSRF